MACPRIMACSLMQVGAGRWALFNPDKGMQGFFRRLCQTFHTNLHPPSPQVLGPRYTFLQGKGMAHLILPVAHGTQPAHIFPSLGPGTTIGPDLAVPTSASLAASPLDSSGQQRDPATSTPSLAASPLDSSGQQRDPATSTPCGMQGDEGPSGPQGDWLLLLTALVAQPDEDWCRGLGLEYREYREHAVHFQTDYNEKVTQVSGEGGNRPGRDADCKGRTALARGVLELMNDRLLCCCERSCSGDLCLFRPGK